MTMCPSETVYVVQQVESSVLSYRLNNPFFSDSMKLYQKVEYKVFFCSV